jgi:leucine-rich repeat-containing protein 49
MSRQNSGDSIINFILYDRFNCINFNSVSPQFTQLRQRYPSIEEFIFRDTNIYCLAQLNALAELQGISALTIEEDGNAIFAKDWRTYAIYRLAHWGLEKINGDVATDNMVKSAEQEFSGLSDVVLKSLPGSLLLPLIGRLTLEAGHPGPPPSAKEAKEWIYISADPNFRSVVAKEALQWKRGMSTQVSFIFFFLHICGLQYP